jgi:ribosomal protein L7Ae-like RNA K-turn-binding protein
VHSEMVVWFLALFGKSQKNDRIRKGLKSVKEAILEQIIKFLGIGCLSKARNTFVSLE